MYIRFTHRKTEKKAKETIKMKNRSMNSATEIRAIANNEAERLIGLLYERFDDPMDAKVFMQPLNHMLLGGDYRS
jgi:hypothetical protein